MQNISKIMLTKFAIGVTLMIEARKGGNNMAVQETKRERFIRLAEARTNKIIDMIQLLGNCSNSSTYDYTQEDVDKIFNAIESEVRETKKKFSKSETKKNTRFSLK